MIRRRHLLYVLAALAVPIPAFGIGVGSSAAQPLDVGVTLDQCGIASTTVVCKFDASYNSVAGARYYTASVTGPDGSVVDYGDVSSGGTSLWVPYVGDGTYTVTVSAWGDVSGQHKPKPLATGSASAGQPRAGDHRPGAAASAHPQTRVTQARHGPDQRGPRTHRAPSPSLHAAGQPRRRRPPLPSARPPRPARRHRPPTASRPDPNVGDPGSTAPPPPGGGESPTRRRCRPRARSPSDTGTAPPDRRRPTTPDGSLPGLGSSRRRRGSIGADGPLRPPQGTQGQRGRLAQARAEAGAAGVEIAPVAEPVESDSGEVIGKPIDPMGAEGFQVPGLENMGALGPMIQQAIAGGHAQVIQTPPQIMNIAADAEGARKAVLDVLAKHGVDANAGSGQQISVTNPQMVQDIFAALGQFGVNPNQLGEATGQPETAPPPTEPTPGT